jgi:uncharacterized protein (TIGR02453 family)
LTARNKPSGIGKSTLDFLSDLSQNNNREWFARNKTRYLDALEDARAFAGRLSDRVSLHDRIEPTEGGNLYRVYRDVRFSKNKSPYNARFGGYLRRVKPHLRGGYYFWIAPGRSRVACGFAHPDASDLRRLREDINLNFEDWKNVLNEKGLRSTFGALRGERLKTAPRGFPRDHPAIELLTLKQFWFEHALTDKEVMAPSAVEKMSAAFRAIRPFFDYASEVLTTDLNGESII